MVVASSNISWIFITLGWSSFLRVFTSSQCSFCVSGCYDEVGVLHERLFLVDLDRELLPLLADPPRRVHDAVAAFAELLLVFEVELVLSEDAQRLQTGQPAVARLAVLEDEVVEAVAFGEDEEVVLLVVDRRSLRLDPRLSHVDEVDDLHRAFLAHRLLRSCSR